MNLILDKEKFSIGRASLCKHDLVDHPLLSLESLLKLSKRLPEKQVRYYNGRVGVEHNLETVAHDYANGLGLEDTFRDIETGGSYVFLQKLETDAEYAPLVHRLLDQVEPHVLKEDSGMYYREAWMFISAPNTITPYHRDHESPFLLQIKGSKAVHVFNGRDPEIVSEEESEIFHGLQSLKATKYRPELESKAEVFTLTPGLGLYMPYSWPHWVQNGPEYSVSLSVTYHSRGTDREMNVYKANYGLRKRGLRPAPYLHSPLKDTLKDLSFRSYMNARQILKLDSKKESSNQKY